MAHKSQSIIDVKSATQDDYAMSNFNSDPKATHATADKIHTTTNNSLTIIEYLSIINDCIFKKNNIHFATCTPHSLLREHFDFVELDSLKETK
jgi:hypothetical protein